MVLYRKLSLLKGDDFSKSLPSIEGNVFEEILFVISLLSEFVQFIDNKTILFYTIT